MADDLRQADDGDGNDDEANAEYAAETDLLSGIDLEGGEKAEWEDHDEDVRENIDGRAVADTDDTASGVDGFRALAC